MALGGNRLNNNVLPAATPSFSVKVPYSYAHNLDDPFPSITPSNSSSHNNTPSDADDQKSQGMRDPCELLMAFQLYWRDPA